MKEKKLLDFLIVGASKSGTTALSSYLSQNNSVFICEPKEPKYLSYSFLKNAYKGPGDSYTLKKCVKNFSDYTNLFSKAKDKDIKGEASVDMLYHYEQVIPEIKKQLGDPKIIIMLREPSKRAFSAYSHLIRDQRETESFKQGLVNENKRLNDGYEFIWAYKNEGFYFTAVKNYLENFTDVKVVIFEEFIINQQQVVNEVLSFLGVKNFHTIKNALQNKSGKPKFKIINNFFLKDNIIKSIFKSILNEDLKQKIKNFVQNRNLEKIDSDEETLSNLKVLYREDIKKLSNLLERDLSVWN
ncbi:sulfotransferase [uncultured Olleya sp.]|uniref:sulfotransferase family protein n=1 Tax=uncultured Olleya sp. TaxID=757243 RepID=UPI00259611CB|nr:sulfotransferase [uncultured Olleya sp.]